MPFLKIPLDFFDFDEIRRYVNLSGDRSTGLPIRVLCLAGAAVAKKEVHDGHLAGPPDELEALIGWKGRKGQAIEYLLQAQLIAEVDGGYQVNPEIWKLVGDQILKLKHRARAAAKARHSKGIDGAISNA